jgi:hypothetical protein
MTTPTINAMSHGINNLRDTTALLSTGEAENTRASSSQRGLDAAGEPKDRGGSTPPASPPENLSPLVTSSPAREPEPAQAAPIAPEPSPLPWPSTRSPPNRDNVHRIAEPWPHKTRPFAIVDRRGRSAPALPAPPLAWDYPMARALYALDRRECPVPLDAGILWLLDRAFPNRRAAKEALALLADLVLP